MKAVLVKALIDRVKPSRIVFYYDVPEVVGDQNGVSSSQATSAWDLSRWSVSVLDAEGEVLLLGARDGSGVFLVNLAHVTDVELKLEKKEAEERG